MRRSERKGKGRGYRNISSASFPVGKPDSSYPGWPRSPCNQGSGANAYRLCTNHNAAAKSAPRAIARRRCLHAFFGRTVCTARGSSASTDFELRSEPMVVVCDKCARFPAKIPLTASHVPALRRTRTWESDVAVTYLNQQGGRFVVFYATFVVTGPRLRERLKRYTSPQENIKEPSSYVRCRREIQY